MDGSINGRKKKKVLVVGLAPRSAVEIPAWDRSRGESNPRLRVGIPRAVSVQIQVRITAEQTIVHVHLRLLNVVVPSKSSF
jgi:hypothetical protein